jgi:hypothetical protein
MTACTWCERVGVIFPKDLLHTLLQLWELVNLQVILVHHKDVARVDDGCPGCAVSDGHIEYTSSPTQAPHGKLRSQSGKRPATQTPNRDGTIFCYSFKKEGHSAFNCPVSAWTQDEVSAYQRNKALQKQYRCPSFLHE